MRIFAVCLAIVSFTTAQPGVARCGVSLECSFRRTVEGQIFSWDFTPLCREGPEQEPATAIGQCIEWKDIGAEGSGYRVCVSGSDRMVQSPGMNFTFNICGNTTARCSFSQDAPLFYSRGAMIQQFGGIPDPGANCTDWDTGLPCSCTEQCTVVAGSPFLKFRLVDPKNPDGGVIIQQAPMPPNPLDPFGDCFHSENGLIIQRSTSFIIACDPSVDGLDYDTAAAGPDPMYPPGLVLYEFPMARDVGKAVHVWVGLQGSPCSMGGLAAGVPTRAGSGAATDGPYSATCLLGDSGAGNDVAGRLSAHAGKLVLLSLAPAVEEALLAAAAEGIDADIDSSSDLDGSGRLLQPWLETQLRAILDAIA